MHLHLIQCSALRGHCYAYCRPDDDKCWFMFDDSTVSGAELPVATPDAYVLFFRRVSGTPRNLQSLMESDERCQDGSTWIQELERLEAVSIPEAKAAVNMQEERSRKGDVIEPRLGAPKVAATKAKTAAKAKADTVANTETRHAAVSQESSSLENDVAAAKTALRIGNSIATTAVGFEVPSTSLALPSSPDMIGLGLHVDRVLQGFKVLQVSNSNIISNLLNLCMHHVRQIIEGLGAHADGRIAVGDVIFFNLLHDFCFVADFFCDFIAGDIAC